MDPYKRKTLSVRGYGEGWWALLASLWWGWRLVRGVSTGGRRPSLRVGIDSRARIAEVAVSVALLGGLLWAVCQEYLFISSVAPDGAVWLAASLLTLSVVLLASALVPTAPEPPDSPTTARPPRPQAATPCALA